ncbi:metalloregulator ArsR/SmtB family transcription factor [Aggregatilineales bacterium SYSU G02658]
MNREIEAANRLKVMGHPVRLQILEMLRHGEVCVCHIETALGKRQAYISQHLMTLRDAGLVCARRDGLQVYYRLSDDFVVQVLNLVYGVPKPSPAEALEGCSCPQCSIISLTAIP